jgi:hypothetical protein
LVLHFFFFVFNYFFKILVYLDFFFIQFSFRPNHPHLGKGVAGYLFLFFRLFFFKKKILEFLRIFFLIEKNFMVIFIFLLAFWAITNF